MGKEGIGEIRQTNFKEYCFEPRGTRETVGFEPEEKSYQQIYDSTGIQNLQLTGSIDRIKEIRKSKEMIKDHVECSIQLFFQQTILCYKTPFVFGAEGADDQIGKGSKTRKSQAAHPSILPCLYAYPKDAKGKIDPSSRFVYLKYAYSYYRHNSAHELSEEVNKTDTFLHGKANQQKLRGNALKMINKVAEGRMNPTKATNKLLKVFESQVTDALDKSAHKSPRRAILKIYLETIREVGEKIRDSSEIFDQIMGVQIPDDEKVLRKVVYQNRYELIQQAEFIESQIAKRIFEAQKKMTGTKSFKKIDSRLRYTLLDKASSEAQRKFYEKLLCTSLAQLKSRGIDKKTLSSIRNFREVHHREIKKLEKDLTQFRKELQQLEFTFRAKLFKGLRKDYKDWTQPEFVAAFKKRYPNESMSQPMVSCLEQPARPHRDFDYLSSESHRKKELSIEKAKKVARTFGVDVGVFLPGLIASE